MTHAFWLPLLMILISDYVELKAVVLFDLNSFGQRQLFLFIIFFVFNAAHKPTTHLKHLESLCNEREAEQWSGPPSSKKDIQDSLLNMALT